MASLGSQNIFDRTARWGSTGMPLGVRPDVTAYWEDAFRRLAQTATWKKYFDDNQFEDGFQKCAAFSASIDRFTGELPGILSDAGVKIVR